LTGAIASELLVLETSQIWMKRLALKQYLHENQTKGTNPDIKFYLAAP